MVIAVVALAVAVVVLGVLVISVLRGHAEILRALHDLGINLDPSSTAPAADSTPAHLSARGVHGHTRADDRAADVAGHDPKGAMVQVGVVGRKGFTLLAFLSSGCMSCLHFWEAFAASDLEVPAGARLVVITKGPHEESASAINALAPPGVTTVLSSEAYGGYGVPVAPYFVLVDGPSGRIVGEGAATSWAQVSNLMRQSLADAGIAEPGDPAPAPRLDGPARAARIDAALESAGIGPGHPSLHPNPQAPNGNSTEQEGAA